MPKVLGRAGQERVTLYKQEEEQLAKAETLMASLARLLPDSQLELANECREGAACLANVLHALQREAKKPLEGQKELLLEPDPT